MFLEVIYTRPTPFAGKLNEDPEIVYAPSPGVLVAYLEKMKRNGVRRIAYDTETDSVDSLTTQLRCIGIGTEEKVFIIPFSLLMGQHDSTEIKPRQGSSEAKKGGRPVQEEAIRAVLKNFFTDPYFIKVAHNGGT